MKRVLPLLILLAASLAAQDTSRTLPWNGITTTPMPVDTYALIYTDGKRFLPLLILLAASLAARRRR